MFETRLLLLKSEALRRLGNHSEAVGELAKVFEIPSSASLSLLADRNHLKILLLVDLGAATSANRHRRRLERIRQSTAILHSSFLLSQQFADEDSATGSSQPLADFSESSAGEIIEALTALLDFAPNPELLGREAFTFLAESGTCVGVALIVRRTPRAHEILECAGWDDARAAAAVRASSPHAVVALGQRGNRTFELVVEPARDLVSRCTVVAVRKVIAAALALERYRRDERQRASLWPEHLDGGGEEIVASAPMIETLTTARKIAPLEVPVLVTGETGTGKEMLARAIHRGSPRAHHPFLPFNCTAVPRDMLESQLFGYRRGAFTGAHEAFPGIIRAAAGGTLFLDEIGELPLDIQPKLLRFLDAKEIHPLGEPHPIHVDVRVIAATNASLEKMVAQGRFREDLFYRLNVIPFALPPLRERREEIPLLAQHFLQRACEEFKKGRLRLSDETLEYLLLYGWPGNIRQLANEIRRMAALAEPDATLDASSLSAEIQASRRTVRAERPASTEEVTVRLDQPLAEALATVERTMVRRALERSHGRVEEAARLLGISRKGLFLKRRRWAAGSRQAS
jgi:DNA-binding NtrC family response regulator